MGGGEIKAFGDREGNQRGEKEKQARPDNDASGLCLSVYWSCDICMERQMDEQTGEKTLKTCWLIICFSAGSHRGQKQPRNAFFAQAWRRDRQTDGPTDPLIEMRFWRTHLEKKKETMQTLPLYLFFFLIGNWKGIKFGTKTILIKSQAMKKRSQALISEKKSSFSNTFHNQGSNNHCLIVISII